METGKLLIWVGAAVIVLGLVWLVGARLGLGRLPGDLGVRGEGYSFYFPLATCLLLSVLVSVVLWLVQWLRG